MVRFMEHKYSTFVLKLKEEFRCCMSICPQQTQKKEHYFWFTKAALLVSFLPPQVKEATLLYYRRTCETKRAS